MEQMCVKGERCEDEVEEYRKMSRPKILNL
jgi:hypothetical protein